MNFSPAQDHMEMVNAKEDLDTKAKLLLEFGKKYNMQKMIKILLLLVLFFLVIISYKVL